MAHLVETMFYAGETPWHGLGTGVQDAQTSEEAIKLAGLDWDVELGDVWAGPNKMLLKNKAVYRKTDGHVLGITTDDKSYTPIQNREMFDFMDKLVADRVMRFETAGSLMGGRRIWLLAKMDEDIEIAGDQHVPYLLMVNGHDLQFSARLFPTVVRVVCNNTLTQAVNVGEKSNDKMVRIVHTGNVQDKLSAAADVLRITTEQMRRQQEWLSTLTEVEVTAEQIEAVRSAFFQIELGGKISKQKVTGMEQFSAIYNAEKELHGDTAYTLVQTLTGYSDHGIGVRDRGTGEERMVSSLFGGINTAKNRGIQTMSLVLKDAGVKIATLA